MHFDILSCLCVDHECDNETDGEKDRTGFSNSAIWRPALKIIAEGDLWHDGHDLFVCHVHDQT